MTKSGRRDCNREGVQAAQGDRVVPTSSTFRCTLLLFGGAHFLCAHSGLAMQIFLLLCHCCIFSVVLLMQGDPFEMFNSFFGGGNPFGGMGGGGMGGEIASHILSLEMGSVRVPGKRVLECQTFKSPGNLRFVQAWGECLEWAVACQGWEVGFHFFAPLV